MHDTMIGTTGMDQESHPAHDSSPYGTSVGWVDYHSYNPSANMYMSTGLPSDSLSRIAPSPATIHSQPQQSQPQSTSPPSHHQPHHPQLPMLITPSHTPSHPWPSMLIGPGSYAPAPPTAPAVAPAAPSKAQRNSGNATPRKTLTDDDRRRMCQFAEDHPTMKQADIGIHFGVERSTVSKVLGRKDKYLNQEDRSASPAKRSKGKLPNIEQGVAKWARKIELSGVEVSDEELRGRFGHFAHGVDQDRSDEFIQKLDESFLEKFKQKYKVGQRSVSRRASETNIPTNAKLSTSSPLLAHSQQSSGISPASPTVQPSPLSGARSDDDLSESMSGLYGFRNEIFKRGNNLSSTSLSSSFTETATSTVSPTGPFTFSPDSNMGGFLSDQRHLPPGPESNFQRPRSRTCSSLNTECLNQQGEDPHADTLKYPISSTAPSSALESPSREFDTRHFAMDSVISSPPQLHHTNSNGSLAGSSKGAHMANTATPISASPVSPSLEDARRGLDLALSYVQRSTSCYDENEMMGVIRFFESVGIRQYAKAPGSSMHPMSGLSRIPEGGEAEMGNPSTATVKLESMMA